MDACIAFFFLSFHLIKEKLKTENHCGMEFGKMDVPGGLIIIIIIIVVIIIIIVKTEL